VGLRLWRRIKIAPGVTLNVSKSGLSTSFGRKGAKVTVGHGRIRKTVGLPGTGLFYTTTSKSTPRTNTEPAAGTNPAVVRGGGHGLRNAAIAVVLVAGGIAALSSGGSSPQPSSGLTALPTTAATPLTTPMGLIGGGAVSPGTQPSSTGKPAATAKPTMTPKPLPTKAPKATPKPTPKPALALSATVTSPVNAGAHATVRAKTHPGARCSIEVDYLSGPSTASGLNDKKASAAGSVSWTWKVGSNTKSGTWDIYVTCSWSSLEKTKHLTFRVH
jgi:hypothetical protein